MSSRVFVAIVASLILLSTGSTNAAVSPMAHEAKRSAYIDAMESAREDLRKCEVEARSVKNGSLRSLMCDAVYAHALGARMFHFSNDEEKQRNRKCFSASKRAHRSSAGGRVPLRRAVLARLRRAQLLKDGLPTAGEESPSTDDAHRLKQAVADTDSDNHDDAATLETLQLLALVLHKRASSEPPRRTR